MIKNIFSKVSQALGRVQTTVARRVTPVATIVAPVPKTYGQVIVETAAKEVGVREEPRNSNRGPRVDMYQLVVGTWALGGHWCASFVSAICKWAAESMGKETLVPITGGVTRMWRKSNERGLLCYTLEDIEAGRQSIQPGDIFILCHELNKVEKIRNFEEISAPSHTGLCDGVYNSSTKEYGTIEGNGSPRGSRNGDGVYNRSRNLSDRKLVGFIRPKLKD
jgi:hypothetical protein